MDSEVILADIGHSGKVASPGLTGESGESTLAEPASGRTRRECKALWRKVATARAVPD